ncbi:cytochrome P450 CYP749A22-like isoform X2 [Syzygium oleosum]|uniref:cytochrome P450 CYP749A22-like isoform X2 n=1 Tax=Syzygium oleosum TaxID=219896 RepID=UPI0024BAE077|nr:cytochrome P450 CYP749A22-like isoform X2 [Syzygium oleosum]
MIVLWTSLFLLLFSALAIALHKLWWTPLRIQKMMASQGIRGPPYKLFYGNTRAILQFKNEASSRPLNYLSHDIFPRVQPHISAWTRTYGANYLGWYGPLPRLIVTEPELIKEVLNNKDKAFPKPATEGFLKKLLGDGLVTTEGEKWAKQPMIDSVHMMLERWKNLHGDEIDVYQEFTLLTSEVISRTAFGSSYMEGRNIFEMLRKLTLIVSRNAFKIRFPGISKLWKTNDELESEELENGIRDAVLEIIRKREEKVKAGELDDLGNDFLGLLVKASHSDDESRRITITDLVDECKTFYIAGHDTSNTMLTWTVFLLAIHPDWQDEARKEVLNVFGNQDPDPDGIAKLKTMGMIINESLRLYPPVVGIIREVGTKARLGKLVLPANIGLYIPNLKLHHDPQIWGNDVQLFKPERFSEGVTKATNNNLGAFIPFGLGPRTCVGFNFATMEAKIALSMILQRYTFSLSPAYVHSPTQLLTTSPQRGVQVILHTL